MSSMEIASFKAANFQNGEPYLDGSFSALITIRTN